MAFQATVFNVMIASPGDLQVERNVVRQVVLDWNAAHAGSRRAILQPVAWETHSTPLQGDRPQAIINSQVLKDSDLLIAAFWTRLGTPTGVAASGTVEEIEAHLAAGKPALLYFSSAPVAPDSVDPKQYKALKDFKKVCQSRGLYQEYESSSEFGDKLRQHLALTLNQHPYFRSLVEAESPSPPPPPAPSVPDLTREAHVLLVTAAANDGKVAVISWLGGHSVQAGKTNFVEQENPRSRAIWEGAVRELISNDLLEPIGHKGEWFKITRRGYEVADLLKVSA